MAGFEHTVKVNGQVIECDTHSLSWIGCMTKELVSDNGNSPVVGSKYPSGVRGMKSAGYSESEIVKFSKWVAKQRRDGLSAAKIVKLSLAEQKVRLSPSTIYRLCEEYL